MVTSIKRKYVKDPLTLSTKNPYLFFDNTIYTRVDEVTVGTLLGSGPAKILMTKREKNSYT